MKRGSRKFMSLALCLFLLIGALPLSAAAEDAVRTTGIEIDYGGITNATYACEGTEIAAWNATFKTLTFTGTCTIDVSGAEKDAVLISGSSSNTAYVVVEDGADVTLKTSGAEGGYPLFSFVGLKITVENGGSLTVENSTTDSRALDAIISGGPLDIQVDAGGSLIARSTATNTAGTAKGSALSGDGVSITNNGSLTAAGNQYGIYNISSRPVTIGGSGVTLVAGGAWGIISFHQTVTVDPGTKGLVAGKTKAVDFAEEKPNPGFVNNAADTFAERDGAPADLWGLLERDPDFTDHSAGLDLSGVTKAACYSNVGGGLALWEYGGGSSLSNHHKLTLVGAKIVPGDLKLPAGDAETVLYGENLISAVGLTAGNANSLTLSGFGSLEVSRDPCFTGVDDVSIGPPQAGWYATARWYDSGGSKWNVPGSVFREGRGGMYAASTEASKFDLTYGKISGLGTQKLLTVEYGYGGGVYEPGNQVNLNFARGDDEPFYGWELFDPETGKSLGTAGIEKPSFRGTTFTMPAEHTAVRAIVEQPVRPTPPPGPSLETGEHGNYLNGYPDGTIRPEKNLTREETAQLFYNLMDEASRERYESRENPFSDVKEGWSYTAICTLANAGILKGDPDGNFRPSGTVTRAEFAAIAARFEPGTYAGDDLFPDIAGHWARENINYAAQKGWVQGYKDGTFRPNANITRAEAATLINHMLERAPETVDDLLPGRKVFSDNGNEKAWYYLALEEAANSHEYERKDYSGPEETWTALK